MAQAAEVTKLDLFFQVHVQSKQAIQILDFLKQFESMASQVRSSKGKIMVALLNQAVYKLLVLLEKLQPSHSAEYQTCLMEGEWIEVP